ncbi:MAG: transglycosylase SLT domain-containing protein [Chloroflexota bacterium]
MKKILLLLLLAGLAAACTLPFQSTPQPTIQPPPTSGPTLAPTQAEPTIPPPALPTVTAAPPTPDSPSAELAAADQALFNGDWETAQAEFQKARDAAAGRGDADVQAAAQLGLGRVYYLLGDYHSALNTLRDLVERFPQSAAAPDAYFFLGQAYEALTRYLEAADAYLNYLALRSGVIDAYLYELRGDALFAGGDYPSALKDYLAAFNSPRLNTPFLLEIKIARTYAITGDIPTAIIMYTDLYQRAEDGYTRAQIDYLRGQAHAAIGETDQAASYYLDAVNHYPFAYSSYLSLIELIDAEYPVDELQRGIVDYHAGEYAVAGLAFDRYLEANPVDPATAHYFKGMSLYKLGNYYEAIPEWDAVIESHPNSEYWDEAWEMKAYTQWAYQDDYETARQTLLDFVATRAEHPRSAEFLYDAATVAERAGNLLGAIMIWDQVAANYPASGYRYKSLFQKGIASYRLANYPTARDAFLKAYEVAPTIGDQSALYLWIGKTFKAEGNEDSARSSWSMAAGLDPTGYYSERARDLLADRAPFSAPSQFNLGIDWNAERQEAEAWLRQAFQIDAGANLADLGALASDPRMLRGNEYWRLGLHDNASAEFESLRISVESDPADTYRLMNYFYNIGLYRSAIYAARGVLTLAGMGDAATLDAPRLFNHVRFGPYYADLVIPHSQETNLHPLFVWSAMRQESFFEPFIGSSAGALGLMQIMPQTGQALATQLGWPENFRPDDLYRPLVSTRLGLRYLDQQRQYFNGDLYAALAAYNAGPGNAAIWYNLANGDPDLLLEIIRLDEPKRYIRAIYEMFNIYSQLYEQTQ